MKTTKKAQPAPMLLITNDKLAIREAREAINDILKAQSADSVKTAALNALVELARAPQHTTINNCQFSNI